MQKTRGLALEIRLSAYIDGEVDESERAELEALVARDDQARLVFEMLKAGNAFGNKAMEAILHDPVPLALVRRIKQGTGGAPLETERVAEQPNARALKSRMWWQGIAAAIVLLLLGGSSGYILGRTSNDAVQPADLATARTWLDDIADYHRIFARQAAHRVEMPASQSESLRTWLTASVGVDFTLPDLSAKGLTFEGARLLVAGGKPVAQLVYTNEDGDVFAICFLKTKPDTDTGKMTESMRDDIAMISWQNGAVSYVVVGPSADARLRDLAETVSGLI